MVNSKQFSCSLAIYCLVNKGFPKGLSPWHTADPRGDLHVCDKMVILEGRNRPCVTPDLALLENRFFVLWSKDNER